MPVKIEIGDDSTDPRVISLQSYEDGRANFTLHYYYTSAQAGFGGQVIEAAWNDLQAAITSFINATGVPENEIALRFVHCFNKKAGELYLRLQICQMVSSAEPPPPGVATVYNLDTAN